MQRGPGLVGQSIVHKWNLVAFALALIAIGCTSEPWGCGMGAACPAMADVGGVRYSVSVGLDLMEIEGDLTAFAPIAQTNVPSYFAETTVFSVGGIDPTVLLIARAAPLDGDAGSYRMLSTLRGDHAAAWPQFCRYLQGERLTAQPECTSVASPSP